jgi:hypothetical protein
MGLSDAANYGVRYGFGCGDAYRVQIGSGLAD